MEKFKVTLNEDTDELTIKYIVDGKLVGHLIFEIFTGEKAKEFFADYCTFEEYKKLIPNDRFIYLGYININTKYREQGFGNKLMEKFLNYITNTYNGFVIDRVVLYANPYDFSLQLSILKKFYNRFGFEEIDFETFYEKNSENYTELNFENNIMIKNI